MNDIQSNPVDFATMEHSAKGAIFEMSEAIGARRAVKMLHRLVGNDFDYAPMPSYAPASLRKLRKILTEAVRSTDTDEETIAHCKAVFDLAPT